jgi:riboflavin synthase
MIMFTGIVEDLGTVVDLTAREDAARLTVRTGVGVDDVPVGGSVAVNGCCLTVVERGADWFTADVMAETLRRTSIGTAVPGSRVNIERALRADARLAGHVVQGHVDGTGVLRSRHRSTHWDVVGVEVERPLLRYLAPKGSIAVDGVSLTVVDVDDATAIFTVSLIPETLARTTLGRLGVGDGVNLEVDVIAKYVERMLGASAVRTDELVGDRG